MQTRDAYGESIKTKLDEWNREIDKLETEMKSASEDAKARYEAQLDRMKASMAEAGRGFQDLMRSNEARWQENRGRFEAAWKDISEGFGRAFSRFG